MSRARIRSTQRRGRSLGTAKGTKTDYSGEPVLKSSKQLKFHRFIGLALGGGKTDKTCLSMIEYYPLQKKIFLSRLFDRIRTEGEVSADLQIHRLISQVPKPIESIAFDVPLQLPKCITCRLKCPGYEACTQPEIAWMWKRFRTHGQSKSPPRLFTPYTERCVEQYLQTELEEPFHLSHSLGSNLAPLTARAHFLTRRLSVKAIEVFPKLSLWRMGNALHISRSQLRFHRHWDAGLVNRELVLKKMMEKNLAFIYDQDVRTLIELPQAFDSFLCALTGLLSFLGHCESRPKGFPKNESWIEIPKKVFPWP